MSNANNDLQIIDELSKAYQRIKSVHKDNDNMDEDTLSLINVIQSSILQATKNLSIENNSPKKAERGILMYYPEDCCYEVGNQKIPFLGLDQQLAAMLIDYKYYDLFTLQEVYTAIKENRFDKQDSLTTG